jgi:hypothetical protein
MKRKVKLTYRGKAYPTPHLAQVHMMLVAEAHGVAVEGTDIVAEEVEAGSWIAYALVDRKRLPDTLRLAE